jgi:TatD DNase family protein
MKLIDTHTHIYLEELKNDRVQILHRAAAEGVTRFFLPAIDSSTHEQMLDLEKEYPSQCSAMMGLHPCSVKENYKEELSLARQYFDKRKFCAVGEIGLDFYWDQTFTKEQYAAFHEQIEWALHFDIPIVIHSRNSTNECIEVVKQHQQGNLKGIFHCFSGDVLQAQKIIELGLLLGIGGVVTFKNSGLDKVVEQISLEHLVLETDAPYLAPVPFRGKRNEPSYLKYVIEKIAGIKNITIEEVARVTTKTAEKIFGI